ncbi:MAG TPA: hypothetical protein VLJ17_24465 [Xanthobacteraceae bacterium]|nr:hypothetical protein [Xanthobacteraceae bacterium]
MPETYTRSSSQVVTATHNANSAAGSTKTISIPDSKIEQGSRVQAMRSGTSFLTKGLDGTLTLHVFDAELSTPNNPVLRRV